MRAGRGHDRLSGRRLVESRHGFHGWVFYWNSRRFLETGDARHALSGNAPFIIDRRDGSVRPLGTGYPLQQSIRAFADVWAAGGGQGG